MAVLFSCLLLMSSCVTLHDYQASQEQHSTVIGSVHAGQPFSQELISRRDEFNGIGLWLQVNPDFQTVDGLVSIEILESVYANRALAAGYISFEEIRTKSPVWLEFRPIGGSEGKLYNLVISVESGAVDLLGVPVDIYPQGDARAGDQVQLSDAAFKISYQYGWENLVDDLRSTAANAWLIIPLALALYIPGWFVLDLSGWRGRFDRGSQAALSIGLSLAVIPVAMSWTSALGLRWSQTGVWVVVAMLAALVVYRRVRNLRLSTKSARSTLRHLLPNLDNLDWALLAVLVFSLVVRLIMVRDLSAPPWVDPAHHALFTRLIMESGGFPDTYAPYIQIETASYHPGFHSVLAVFLWLSGLDMPVGMLFYGQVLNALVLLSTYLFTVTLSNNRIIGVVAALVAGMFTPMPAYYTSWGRYTQLTGLLVMPVAFALVAKLLERDGSVDRADSLAIFYPGNPGRGGLPLLAGLACGGLFLAHYRVAVFFVLLITAHLLVLFMTGNIRTSESGRVGIALLATGFGATVLILPWLPEAFSTLLIPKLETWRPAEPGLVQPFADFSWAYLNSALGKQAIWIAALGTFLGLLRRMWYPLSLAIWVALLFLVANLEPLGLAGSGIVNSSSVVITLFMPIAALAGLAPAILIDRMDRIIPLKLHKLHYAGWVVIGLVSAAWGASELINILNPTTFLFRQQDRPALEWIEANLSPSETILINPFAWGYGLFAGNDGGAWIPALTGHPSMPPPVLYGLSERLDYVQHIDDISRSVIEAGTDAERLHQIMTKNGLRFVYLGGRGGAISAPALLSSSSFQNIYAKDGVWLFEAR